MMAWTPTESADPANSPVSAENGAELTVGGSSAPILERVKPTDPAILEMVRAHYSHKSNTAKRPRTAKTSKTWWSNAKLIVFSDPERTFVFAWQWPRAEFRRDKQSGFNNTLFHRTERCPFKASAVLIAAEQAVVAEWGENRAYTYIDPTETKEIKIRGKRVVGYAYLKAGWRFVKIAESGKHLFEKHLSTYHPQRGGNSNGLHVTQGSAPESDRHPASALTLDRPQGRNGCVAQMDMPQHDAARPADESGASAGNSDHLWTDEHLKNCPSCYQQYWRGRD